LYFGTNYIQFKTSSGTTLINHSSTAALRLITLPDKSGTLATTSDIPDVTAYASLLDYITVVEDNGETFHSLNDNTMVAGQFAATDLIYSDNALVAPMIWGDNLYGGSVTCDAAEFGALTLTGDLTSSSKIYTSGIIQGNEGYINTQYITANLFSLNDENTIRMGGNFKIRAYGNASGSISASGNISSDASIYATDSLYAGSKSQTGYVRLYEKDSTDYTRFSKSQLRIAGDVDTFEITGATKTTGNLTAGNMLFVENDSYLKGSSYTGAIYLHYGN
jgi:hypothetical protein